MIRSFLYPFISNYYFLFASHLNCMVKARSSFFLGQFVICLDSISFNPI